MTVSKDVRLMVIRRDSSRCVKCGKRISRGDWYQGRASIHHRRLRSHRFCGTDLPANLILLCGSGTTGCHGWCHSHPRQAMEEGLIVSAYKTPSMVPLRSWKGVLALDDEGGTSLQRKEDGLQDLVAQVAAERKHHDQR